MFCEKQGTLGSHNHLLWKYRGVDIVKKLFQDLKDNACVVIGLPRLLNALKVSVNAETLSAIHGAVAAPPPAPNRADPTLMWSSTLNSPTPRGEITPTPASLSGVAAKYIAHAGVPNTLRFVHIYTTDCNPAIFGLVKPVSYIRLEPMPHQGF